MSYSEPKEITRAKQLIDEGKHNEALQLLKTFEENKERIPNEILASHLLNCEVLRQQGMYEDLIKVADQTYNESLRLGKNLQSVDALLYMAEALLRLFRFDKAFEIIIQGEEELQTLTHQLPTEYKRREAYVAFLKGWFYYPKGESEKAIEFLNDSLKMQYDLGVKQDYAQTRTLIAWIHAFYKGEVDTALKYGNEALLIAKECNKKYYIAIILNVVAAFHSLKGDLDQTILLQEESLKIFRELNNKSHTATVLNNMGDSYKMKGELDHALECLEQNFAPLYELGFLKQVANNHDFLIEILLEKGDIERARQYLQDMEKLKNQLNDDDINVTYLLDKALILKRSSRAINRGKAEEILKQLLYETLEYGIKIRILINLSELLITELHLTNEIEVLDEIKSLIDQLLDIAEKANSHWILCETYLLQAKLALVTLDLKKARHLLTLAQNIAEKYKLKSLAMKISVEHDELLTQLQMWENIVESESSLPERLKLARLNEQMENVVRKRTIDLLELSDEEPVLLLIVSEGGTPLFSQTFIEDQSFKDHLFGGFLTTINSFIGEMFSEGLDRASFGEHTLLMNSVAPFFMCYIFKGQSYYAQHRIKFFINKIQGDKDVWEMFEKYYKLNKEIQLKDIPSLEPLLKEIFIDKTIVIH